MDHANFKSRILSTFHSFQFIFDEDLDQGKEIKKISTGQQILTKGGAFVAGGLIAALGTKYPKFSENEVKIEVEKIGRFCDAVALRLDTGGAILALFIFADDLTDDAIIAKSVLIRDQMKSFNDFTMKMAWSKKGVMAKIFYIFFNSEKAFHFRQNIQKHCKHKQFWSKLHVEPWGIDVSARSVWGNPGLFTTTPRAEMETKLFS